MLSTEKFSVCNTEFGIKSWILLFRGSAKGMCELCEAELDNNELCVTCVLSNARKELVVAHTALRCSDTWQSNSAVGCVKFCV